ncbi:hypothetical protein M011DRAFT_472398 [Sporormia fimetaria CBS 119925]|uniref:Snf7-domain-containing protein n=1 Tax=Sporormia fimetaria CBS 119925 TaxID=1340428 RepID=A0A6A6UXM1_9PLEO|nr:hypothetical protein M011DRAFT_472398 [Sporormia fimetaria CBS 119925]
MAKRRRSISDGLGGGSPAPDRRSLSYEHDERATKRLFRTPGRDILSAHSPTKMSGELLDFILQHEEAFRSRNRLSSLYADFTLHASTNPDSYTANLSTWQQALAHASLAGVLPPPASSHTPDILSIRSNESLLRALAHPKFGRPVALPAVFQDAIAKKAWIPRKDFLERKESIYARSWVPSPLEVVRWSLRALGVLGGPGARGAVVDGEFVVVKNVEDVAAAVVKRVAEEDSGFAVDRVLSTTYFLERFRDAVPAVDGAKSSEMGMRDLDVLLRFLERDKGVVVYDEKRGVVKFKSEREANVRITEEDVAIANMRDTISNINKQIAELETRVREKDQMAREAVTSKQMIQAKAALRSKKLAEGALQHRHDVVAQLESVFAQLQHAADQVEIVEAMRQGAMALKGLNEKVGGVEGVAGVMDALSEQMSFAEEISTVIEQAGQPVDEGEIEDEFEELERVDREKREREQRAREEAEEARRRAERDKEEQEEAERKRRRLEELEKWVKQKREAAAARQERGEPVPQKEVWMGSMDSQMEESEESAVERASQDMARLSFVEENADETETGEEKRVPVPA